MQLAIGNLAKSIAARRTILFAGAGVSMSVGLPSWSVLADHLCVELQLDPSYRTKIPYPFLAEYYRLQTGSIGPLRSWMDRTWNVPKEQIAQSAIHRLIAELDFPIVYTTNYDNNLELAYQAHGLPFTKIVGVRDLTRVTDDCRQIVKFHGDFSDDESLVITESDYLDRLDFESPLDIKFRSDALGRSLLFVGYSLSDPNIRLVLHRLRKTWGETGRERDRPGIYLFSPVLDPVRDAVLGQWGITPLTEPHEDPATSLRLFLEQLKIEVDQERQALG